MGTEHALERVLKNSGVFKFGRGKKSRISTLEGKSACARGSMRYVSNKKGVRGPNGLQVGQGKDPQKGDIHQSDPISGSPLA